MNERLSSYGKMEQGFGQVELKRFECGYHDLGALKHDPYAPVQAGCVAYTIGKRDGGENEETTAVVNHIPAAVDPVWDDSWPEVWELIDGNDFCMETEMSFCNPDADVEVPEAP